MKYRGHAKQRDLNEPEIVEALRNVGAKVYLLDQPVDLLVGWRGETFLLEVKRGDKDPAHRRLTKLETAFFRAWPGARIAVVRCPREALCVVGADRHGAACTLGCGGIEDPRWFTAEREAEQRRARETKRQMGLRKRSA